VRKVCANGSVLPPVAGADNRATTWLCYQQCRVRPQRQQRQIVVIGGSYLKSGTVTEFTECNCIFTMLKHLTVGTKVLNQSIYFWSVVTQNSVLPIPTIKT
jgi:hypothetical protein